MYDSVAHAVRMSNERFTEAEAAGVVGNFKRASCVDLRAADARRVHTIVPWTIRTDFSVRLLVERV